MHERLIKSCQQKCCGSCTIEYSPQIFSAQERGF